MLRPPKTQANISQLPIDPAQCTVIMEDITFNATLVTRLSSNKISRRHCKVSCSLKSLYNNVITKCKVGQTGAGKYSIQCTPTVRGRHELTVSVDRRQVAGSPFPVFVSIPPTQLGKPVKVWTNVIRPTGISVNSVGEILKSVRVHFAPGKIAITFEILGQFPRFLDQNERHGLPVLLIYRS